MGLEVAIDGVGNFFAFAFVPSVGDEDFSLSAILNGFISPFDSAGEIVWFSGFFRVAAIAPIGACFNPF